MEPLYTYTDYKKYLSDIIDENESVRGYKSQLAEAAQCQRSFMSSVINSHVHLTPDHALGLAEFWKFNSDSTEYFLEMVHYGRAATPALRSHLLKRLKKLGGLQKSEAIRLHNPTLQDLEHQSIFYSHWTWSALHLLLSVKRFQSDRAIAEHLNMPIETVRQALGVLQSMGLAKREKDAWMTTGRSLHVPIDSVFAWMHHGTWRSRANENMRAKRGNAIHFTSVYSLSAKDRDKIDDLIVKFLESTNKIVAPSPEEEVACLCIDWFGV